MIKEEKWRKGGVDEFTLFWSIEFHIELLHAIIDHLHLIVTHHPSSHQSNPRNQKNPKKKNKIRLSTEKRKKFYSYEFRKITISSNPFLGVCLEKTFYFLGIWWKREMKIWVFLLEKQRQAKGVQTRKERNYEYSDIYVWPHLSRRQ